MGVMQLSKGPKTLIAAILAIVIALWRRSQKVKAALALTNTVASKVTKVSTASKTQEDQSCKELQHKAEEKVEEEAPVRTPCEKNEDEKVEEEVPVPTPCEKDFQHMEVSLGDKVLHSDGQEGVIEAFDGDGDLKIRRLSNGSIANWYARKCSKAEIEIGDTVTHACGEKARVDSFDPDGDVTVKKSDGSTATWYRNKTTGGPIKMSRKDSMDSNSISIALVGA